MKSFTQCLRYLITIEKRRIDKPLKNSLQYFIKNDQNRQISAWSDIDIKLEGDNVTVVIQIPKQSSAKTQLIKELPNHPIMQDTRKNKQNQNRQLRHYALPLPLINYGFIPMTWEQNIRPDQNGFYGDDDPIDVIDLSEKQRKILDISRQKVLGSFCLIDQGELDWKILTIDPEQAKSKKIDSFKDISKQSLEEIMNWFKIYKTYDGKAQNKIGFDDKIFNKQETLKIIHETHQQFLKLREGKNPQYQKRKIKFHLV